MNLRWAFLISGMAGDINISQFGIYQNGIYVNGMNVDANRTCGKCLSQIRREQGITQVELAKKLGVPQSFISKVETGERSLRVYEQFVYADALGITVETLVRKLGAVLSSEDN